MLRMAWFASFVHRSTLKSFSLRAGLLLEGCRTRGAISGLLRPMSDVDE